MEMQVAGRIPHRYPSLSKRISCVLATHPSHEMNHQTVAAEHPVMLSTNGIQNGIHLAHGVVRYPTDPFFGCLKYTMMSLRTWNCNGEQLQDFHDGVCFPPEVIARRCDLFSCEPHMFRIRTKLQYVNMNHRHDLLRRTDASCRNFTTEAASKYPCQ